MLLASSSLPLLGMPGLWEWIIIIAVVLIFFGAAKLPKLGKGLGEGIRNFKTAIKGDEENRAHEERDPKQDGEKRELNS